MVAHLPLTHAWGLPDGLEDPGFDLSQFPPRSSHVVCLGGRGDLFEGGEPRIKPQPERDLLAHAVLRHRDVDYIVLTLNAPHHKGGCRAVFDTARFFERGKVFDAILSL